MSAGTPEFIWWNGRIVPWPEATVHVMSETALRGINVFEGLRAYWHSETRSFAIVALTEHLERLSRSARALRLPVEHLLPKLARGVEELIWALQHRGDLYLRPTAYLEEGGYTANPSEMRVGAFISARPVPLRSDRPVTCVVSSWQRIADVALPTLAKVGATYTAFRLARIEAADSGAEEAILLNSKGTVAETGGASIFVIRDNRVSTPPLSDGVLDGLTRRITIELLSSELGITVTERSISRSELYVADEVFICGTLDEIRAVGSIDRRPLPHAPGKVTRAIRQLYLDSCEGHRTQSGAWWLHNVSRSLPE